MAEHNAQTRSATSFDGRPDGEHTPLEAEKARGLKAFRRVFALE